MILTLGFPGLAMSAHECLSTVEMFSAAFVILRVFFFELGGVGFKGCARGQNRTLVPVGIRQLCVSPVSSFLMGKENHMFAK